MARRYGIPYQGSKSKIAKWVIDNLPSANTFVDLFAGGCAVTHAAIESGKYERFIANDLTDAPNIFKAACEGEFKGFSYVPTREEFYAIDDDVIKLLYSFGNNRQSYLWGKDIEPVKVAASRMISAPSQYERRMHYRKFMHELKAYIARNNTTPNGTQLEGLERLEGLEGLQGLQGLEVTQSDYKNVTIPTNAVIYADPPYRDTCCKAYEGFDFAAFDEWLATVPYMVVVSEYTCPAGCVEIASKQTVNTLAANKTSKVTERLFVQERFKDEYAQRMRETEKQQAISFAAS